MHWTSTAKYLTAAALLLGVSARAQDSGRYTVTLTFRNGRLAPQCPRTDPLCAAIDRVLRTIPVDPAHLQLTFSAEVLPALRTRLAETSPLKGPIEPDLDEPLSALEPLTFTVRDPLMPGDLAIESPLLIRLRSGSPATPAEIRRRLLHYFEARGVTPHIAIGLDARPRSIQVAIPQVHALVFPAGTANVLPAIWAAVPTGTFHYVRRTPPASAIPLPAPLLAKSGDTLIDLADGTFGLVVTPEARQRRTLAAAADYKPGQGFKLLGITDAGGFHVEAGAFHSPVANLSWTRDNIAFASLGMRLALTLEAGTTYTPRRLIEGTPTGERRTSTSVHVELEPFRDLARQTLLLWGAARRESVFLAEIQSPLTTADAGLEYAWNRQLVTVPTTLRIRPELRRAASWSALRLTAEFRTLHTSTRLHAATATSGTPVFELPSLGGAENLRGFREDTLIAHHIWSVQNELWLPLRGPLGLSPFVDLGTGNRTGLGAGPRLRIRGAQFGLDYAFGFGPGASRRGLICFSFRTL